MIDTQEQELIKKWFNIAKRKFDSADKETDIFGKRLISHGAIIHFNCARQLQELIKTRDDSLNFKAQVIKQNRKCP